MKTYHASTEVDRISKEAVESFQANFGGPLIRNDDEIYDAERQLWNKLIDIKTKYDPNNFFRMNANIKPNGQA
jgi:hypothetical protein